MMNTKNIILTAVFMVCGIGATAQDVTVLHMKNGTTKRYTNGVKNYTSIAFYEYALNNTYQTGVSQYYVNGYTTTLDVNQVHQIHGEYVVGLLWEDNIPANFNPACGICFGTKPDLTVENCEEKAYTINATARSEGYTYDFSTFTNSNTHYMWIGGVKDIYLSFTIGQRTVVTPDTTVNFIKTALQKGQTYYYRTFAEGQVLEGGQQKTVVFYGDEHSFRVPRVMDDFDYYSYPKGTKEAITAFATAHFPEGTPIPTWQQLEPLWNKWRATDEGKSIDLSADITSEQFDNGTGYRLNRIPDEFYTWMANREIVIDAFDVADISKYYDQAFGDSLLTVTLEKVTNIDTKWGVPGGKYIRFTPYIATLNHSFTYKSNEVVPGVRYKLCLNFAPETVIENTDTTANIFLPTKIRVNTLYGNQKVQLTPSGSSSTTIEISATETTTINIEDFYTTAMGLNLIYDTRVGSTEVRKNTYNRILRVAEIRLIPMKDE